MRQSLLMTSALWTVLCSISFGGIVVDGTRSGEVNAYGPPVAVQTVNTQFGDNFSEWNAAYCAVIGNRLHLMFTGNLEANFNKLEIFLDTVAGGENVLSGTPGNDGTGVLAGMTFDPGFEPDYHIIARRGFDGALAKFDLDIAQLGTANFDSYFDIFNNAVEGSGATGTGTVISSPIEVGYNNSNTAGIGAGTGAADQAAAEAVKTGLELSIDLADLGNPVGPFRVMLLQNNQDHNFLSNQTLGGLPPGTDNLGSPASGINFGAIGDSETGFDQQFFVVDHNPIPEPTTWVLAGCAALGVVAMRMLRR